MDIMTAGDHNFSQILSDWSSEVGVEAFDHVSHHVKFSVSSPLLWNPGNSVKLFSSRSFAPTSANIGKQKHKENRTKINFCLSVKPHFKNFFLPFEKLWEIISWLLREITKRFFFSKTGDCFFTKIRRFDMRFLIE